MLLKGHSLLSLIDHDNCSRFLKTGKVISMSILKMEDVGNYSLVCLTKMIMEQICLEAPCWITEDSEVNQNLEQAAKRQTSTSDDI